VTSDRRTGGDAPGGASSGTDSGPPPERPDVSGDGDGKGWGAGDYSLPKGDGGGSPGDAGRGHQGPPSPEPPSVDPPWSPGPKAEAERRKDYVGPGAGIGTDGALVGAAPEGGGKPETGHGGGGHRARWAADRPSLDPPPVRRSPPRATNAASQGEQRHKGRTP
jgi:hypothetical protein